MKKLQWLVCSLALGVLMGVMASEARAGYITVNVALNGVDIFQATSTSTTSFTASANALATLNVGLANFGSAYQFSSLGALSDFDGGSTGFLQVNGDVTASRAGNTSAALSIDVTQTGYTSPTGPGGTLAASLNGTFTAVGSTSYTGDFNTLISTPFFAFSSTSSDGGSYSGYTMPLAIGTILSGYEISDHLVISLSNGSGDSFTATTTVVGTAAVVPEPTSIVALLTGMPVLMGLLSLYRNKVKA